MMLSCSNFFLRQVRISKKLKFFVNRKIYMHIILSYGHKGKGAYPLFIGFFFLSINNDHIIAVNRLRMNF